MSKDASCAWRRRAAFWSACLRALCLIFCLVAADDSFSLPNLDQSSIVSLWEHDGDNENDAVRVTRDSGASFSITVYLGELDGASACGPDGADETCRAGRRVCAFPPTGPPIVRA